MAKEKEDKNHNLSDTICWVIAGALWLIGVIMCIVGVAIPGILIIVAAGFFCSPQRVSLVGAFLKEKRAIKKWRTFENILIIVAALGVIALIIFNLPAIKQRINTDTGSDVQQTVSTDVNQPQTATDTTQVAESNDDVSSTYGEGFTGFLQAFWDVTVGGIKTDIDNAMDALGSSNSSSSAPSHPEYVETGVTEESFLEIHFLDVGQGDCILIICDGEEMIIDAGDEGTNAEIIDYILKQDKAIIPGNIKYLCLTHNDADHIGSADNIISELAVGEVWLSDFENDTYSYKSFKEQADTVAGGAYQPMVGSTYKLGSATITILAPRLTHEDINNNSIVLRIDYNGVSALFTGDASSEEELEMLESGYDLDCDILKVGHHGSNSSSSEEFIGAVSPTYAVISCAMNNDYYHPHGSVLNTLRAAGVKLRRTDEEGTIICYIDTIGNITWNVPASETWQAGN